MVDGLERACEISLSLSPLGVPARIVTSARAHNTGDALVCSAWFGVHTRVVFRHIHTAHIRVRTHARTHARTRAARFRAVNKRLCCACGGARAALDSSISTTESYLHLATGSL
jgi:hypothetical protein